ncbi:Fc receptor-like protein 5 isoform X2 [Eleginops maclovinus]|uniref:Fc receptor-like protein 5 isoform X2 n=1 Tax=Eleginops maclovinus TaxID=56733 RepID=UPI003080D078
MRTPCSFSVQTCNRVTYTARSKKKWTFPARTAVMKTVLNLNSGSDLSVAIRGRIPLNLRTSVKTPSMKVVFRSLKDGEISTLRISDLRDSDSAQYLFTFKTASSEWGRDLPGTTLTVTALQVQVIRASVHQFSTFAELRCHSSCSPAAGLYVWFKNFQRNMTEETSTYADYFYPGDNISCGFKGHEDSRSPSIYAPKLPSVSVSPSAEIEEGSSVTLTCSSDANPAANYIWYKENEDSSKASGQIFTITDFRAEHSGSYSCEAQNKLGRSNSTLYLTVVVERPITTSLTMTAEGKQEVKIQVYIQTIWKVHRDHTLGKHSLSSSSSSSSTSSEQHSTGERKS